MRVAILALCLFANAAALRFAKEVEGAASFVKGGGAMANVSSKVSLAQVQAPPSEDKKWDELSSEEKDGARKLGYGKQKWDGDDWVASEGKKWEELDQAEQEGAAALGWNQASWNEDYPCKSLEAHIRKLEKMEKRCMSGTPREMRETCWGQMKAVLPKYLEEARKAKAERGC